jgi:DNA-binding NarL/FixJ family response regulator
VKKPIRTIVVDDFEPWRRFVCSTLAAQKAFWVIGEFADGGEAIQGAKESRPDLILLDISLPTVNGIEVARRIRELTPASRILFVTEHRDQDIAEAALNTGATGYLVKSDAAGELLPAIKAVLEGKRFISSSLAGHFIVATLAAAQTISWMFATLSAT